MRRPSGWVPEWLCVQAPRQPTWGIMCEQDIQNVPVLTSTASLPQAYLLRFVHTHTRFISRKEKCYLASTLLLSFHYWFRLHKKTGLKASGITECRLPGLHPDFSWEARVNFPCIKIERQKMKALGAYNLRFLQKCLHWIMIQGYASLRGW